MSKAPGSVQEYDGSDGWRKLKDWGMVICPVKTERDWKRYG